MSAAIEDRFWSMVERHPTGCWVWTAAAFSNGYGYLHVARKTKLAHRFAYELENGTIPEGLLVCHACDVRRCCRPSHLFLGTPMDNNRDMFSKGRGNKSHGEAHLNAKLTEDAVREIRSSRESLHSLGRKFGVTHNAIKFARLRKTWKHVA